MKKKSEASLQPLFRLALLVEDEVNLTTALQVALRKLEIPVLHAKTLKEARHFLQTHTVDFILLDRHLPDGDGLDLCASLRMQQYPGTILILTASGQLEERVLGLNTGADDYLAKPFSWQELEARIRALARRKRYYTPWNAKPTWSLDPTALKILGPQGWIELTPLEFQLAKKLIQNPEVIISRHCLLKEVWGFTLLPKTRTVDHFLGRLRKYFEKNPEKPCHFLTIRGAGYKFQP